MKELPEIGGEFVELAKEYVRERTAEPAKRLGRLGGYGFAAAILFVLAAWFLGTAATRTLIFVLPDGAIWSGLGYFLGTLTLLGVASAVLYRASRVETKIKDDIADVKEEVASDVEDLEDAIRTGVEDIARGVGGERP